MADPTDFSALSDEELRSIIAGADVTEAPPGQGAEVAATRKAALQEVMDRAPKTRAEEIEPSAYARGAAALGGRLREPFVGVAEKFQLAFPGKGREEETFKRIGQERTERRDIQRQLEETTAGQFGGFLGQAAPFAATTTPAGAAMMAGGLGFLGGGPNQPKSLAGEMATSAASGTVDAAVTGAATKAFQLAGKSVNAARGRYTPEGQEALATDAAAKNLGLPSPTIGQLDPMAPEAIRAHPDLVMQQAQALKQRIAGQQTAPLPGGGTEVQSVPGGKLLEGMRDALGVRNQQARQMYGAVDDFVQQQGLSNVTPNYTLNVLSSANKLTPGGKQPTGNNIVYNLLDHYDPDAFSWLKTAGSTKAAKQQGMSMQQYHDSRVAVGRALSSLERQNPATLTADQVEAKQYLSQLKAALDNDVQRWATQNAGNEEAMGLYNTAKDFYAKTVAPTLNNPLSGKIRSRSRTWASPERMLQDVSNPLNKTLVERLLPTASRETQDALRVLQNLPDVGRTAASGKVPGGAAEQELGAVVRAGLGHPGLAAMELAPGLRWLSTTSPAKRAYFGQELPGRAVNPAAQYPAGGLETWARERLSLDNR